METIQTVGRFAAPQSPWRWDDDKNALVHDRDVTAEKKDLNAETASEKIDLWNLPADKRPAAYEKYPLEVSKDKKIVGIEDIIHVALNMASDTYFVPEKFADFVKRPELEDFFIYLINYFYWFFENRASKERNPMCVELDRDELSRVASAECQMNTALLFVAQKYSNIILGTGLKQFHHFYWIEGNDGDPLTKKRGIIPFSGRVSRTLIDRGYAELLIIFSTFVVWITFERKNFEQIRTEIGRIIRTHHFPNPTYSTTQIRTRSAYKASRDSSVSGSNITSSNSNSTRSDRRNTGTSRTSIRSQKTIATASVESNENKKNGADQQSFRRLLSQRSPVLVALLPSARDQSAWLFSRRNGTDDSLSKGTKMIPENAFRVQAQIGVLGQSIDTLTMITGGEIPVINTS